MCWYVIAGFSAPGTVGAEGLPMPPLFWKLMAECDVPGGRPGGWLLYATAVIPVEGLGTSSKEAVSARSDLARLKDEKERTDLGGAKSVVKAKFAVAVDGERALWVRCDEERERKERERRTFDPRSPMVRDDEVDRLGGDLLVPA
jgi:hypothetical protein